MLTPARAKGTPATEVIRLATPAQLRAALSVFADAFEDRETYLGAQPDDDYLGSLIADPSFAAFGAVAHGRMVGALAGYLLRKFEQPRAEFYIYDLAVAAGHRRRGLATKLISAASRYATDNGAWVSFVQADLDDPAAIALYSKLGTREDVLHFDILPAPPT